MNLGEPKLGGSLVLSTNRDQIEANNFRALLDLTKLNRYVAEVCYHTQNKQEFLSQIAGASVYCKIDIFAAYHQIPIAPDYPIVASVPGDSANIEYNRLPQGLKTSGSLFCEQLEAILPKSEFRNVIKYIDDLLIYAVSLQELFITFKKVIERFYTANIRLNPKKCIFGV